MNKNLFLLLILILVSSLSANWIDIEENKEVKLFDHTSSSKAYTEVYFSLNGYEIETMRENEIDYQKITYINEGNLLAVGKPDLPKFTRLLAVPAEGTVNFEVIVTETEVIEDIDIYPAQVLQSESDKKPFKFAIDEAYYTNGILYPSNIVEIGEPVILRDQRVVSVSVNPFQYDPQSRTLHIVKNVDISVSSSGKGGGNIKDTDRKVSRFFEPIYRSAIMNYDSTVSRDLVYQDPSYLFIYPDAVLSYLEDISDWKHQKGFEVTLASTTETGTTNNSIKTYIQLAYDTWENPPEFVCLVGDVGGYFSIPTFSDTYSGYSGEGDHPYAQLEGNDVLEDVFLGRISIGDIVDMQTYAAKVLKYEKEPFMGETDWYDRAVLVGDPSSSGPSTIFTNQFVAELMHQYAPNIITTEVYSGNYANAMISNLNLGVTYLNYRGWIGMSGFDNSNINSLTNYRKLPFAVFLTCSTGNFASGESRSEAFIRAGSVGNQKGAIAAIGTATSGTHTNFNNCMDAGIYYGIFADGLYNPGGAVNRGKLALYEHYPQNPGNYVDIFSHWNTLIGDPGVELWTGVPQEIVADYETQIFPGTNYLEVTVTDDNGIPQGNAWVSALMGDDVIFVTGYTDANGVVYLPIEANTTGEMNLTITKHNFIPHLGMVQISNEALAISVYNYMVDDDNSGTSSGNEDEMINPGEDIELKVSLKNYGSQTASSITATISTDNDFITIADAVEDFGSIASGSSAFCTDDFDISIDEDVLGGTLIQLDILIEDGSGNQWNEVLFLMVEGINLYATDYIVFNSGNGVFDPGEDVEISVTLSNLGSVNATGIEGLLRCNNSGITISDSIGIFETISAGNSGNNNNDKFSVEASYQILPGSQIPFTLELTNSEGYNNTISFIIEVGVVSLEDPLGPDDYGYYCYDSDDIGYDSAPVYNWIEIDPSYGGSGISLNLYDGGDTGDTEDVDVPFSFNFYGRPYNMVSVCSNGWAVPGGSTQGSFMNSPIPGPQGPSPMISPFWDDLKTGSGNVFYFHDTTLHMFIVEWSHLQTDQTSDEETFQMMILDPLYYSTPTGDAEIIFQYKVVNNTSSGDYSSYHHDHGQYSSVGLEDHTGTVGLEYTFNNSYPTAAIHLQNDLALKFTTAGSIIQDPPISNFNYDSFNFVLSPGSIDTKYLEISNTGEANLVYNISKNYEQPEEGSGGPDSYGYIWTDSDEITGPEYSWRDISGVATEVIFTHNDVGTDLMPIGFDFIYYGEFYSEFRINPNGWIGFGDDNEEWNNLSLPHPNSPRPALIPFWDDLDPLQGGNVYYYSTADSLIIWFDDVIHFPGTYNGTYDFQVIIYEDGTILYQYRTMDGTLDSATIGLQNEVGNIALQMVYNGNFVENNYVVYIERIIDWVNLDQTFGYIPGGESNTISINVSAEELNIGDFLCDLFIVTNDPDANSITIPINLHVDTNVPIISLSTDILNFGDVLIGVDSSDTLFVSNLGEMDLEVTDITNGLAEFSASPVSFTLTPGETEEVIVTFTALEELLYEDVLIIESNDPYNSQYEVSLTGNGNHPADIDDQLPLVTKVGKNYPNPFNPETTIAFSIADNSKHVQLEIFNIKGQKVKTLVNKIMEVGEYNVVWNGKDYSGRKVASGVYFYKFDTKKYHRINKMLLIK